jgi:hypothetical protein
MISIANLVKIIHFFGISFAVFRIWQLLEPKVGAKGKGDLLTVTVMLE